MKDIVRILQDVAEGKGLVYHYGKKSTLNLLDGTPDANSIFLLHEFTNRKSEYNDSGTKIVAVNCEGKFFLVKHSDYDSHFFAERGEEQSGKYAMNIEPLLAVFEDIGNSLSCMELSIAQWDNLDVTDALDANMDGLLCTYKIRIPAGHE